MMPMRVVRFELMKDGVSEGIFAGDIACEYRQDMPTSVGDLLYDIFIELPVPQLDYRNNNYVFYFTRQGIKKFKEGIAMIKKYLASGVSLVIRRAWNVGMHCYIDAYQVAVQV